MIDKAKIEAMMRNAKPIWANCNSCKGWDKSQFVPKPKIRETKNGEEFEIIYVCASCGAER